MTLSIVKGDLFTAPEDYIAHGCNAQGVMGSGVALEIRRRFPDAYKAYMATKPLLVGTAVISGRVINLITQQTYGREKKKYASPEWIHAALLSMETQIPGGKSIAMPAIGAGLGGLNFWNDVEPVLVDHAESFDRNIVVYFLSGGK